MVDVWITMDECLLVYCTRRAVRISMKFVPEFGEKHVNVTLSLLSCGIINMGHHILNYHHDHSSSEVFFLLTIGHVLFYLVCK